MVLLVVTESCIAAVGLCDMADLWPMLLDFRRWQSLMEATRLLLLGLSFHRVAQEFQEDKAPTFAAVSIPFIFDLNGAVKQISLGRMEDVGKVAVRSDYFCGVWVLGDATKPRFLDVIRSKDRFTSINVSPHIPNELVVTNERGSAYLWTVQKGLQKFREEESNLYFNAKSSWRWCDFSCHPRVVVYVDRTGAELTDIRAHDCKHTLFRIGRTPACVSGERVILHKYLGNLHSHQHLINTQFSTYIMDERVPSVPMLKWNHMMESPPSFACALPARTQSQPCKVLLGSQRSQEIMLLQYRGGREQACQTQGAIQKLLSPKESLSYLHSELPHRNHLAQKRLHVPAAGFTALQNEDYLSVFQLVETGDIFFQTLKLNNDQITDNGDVQEQDVSVERPSCENLNLDTNSIDSGTKERRATLRRLEVIDNVCSERDLDINAQICDEPPGKRPSCSDGLVEQSRDSELQNVWETWFKPLFEEAAKKKRSTHFRPVQIGALKNLKKKKQDKLEKDTLTRLRKDLKEAMVKKDLILHGNTYMPHLEIIPLPHPVDPDEWPDDVSQRLAASWEGNWKNWWEDKLGLNKNDKIAALRRKRQREKQAKARRRTSLCGSFTSSGSLSGWSSAGSQFLGSDEETPEASQGSDLMEWKSRTEIHTKSPVMLRRFLNDQSTPAEITSTPQRRDDPDEASASRSLASYQVDYQASDGLTFPRINDKRVTPSLTSSGTLKRQKEFYLSSLPTSQPPTEISTENDRVLSSQVPLSSQIPTFRRLSQFRGSSQASQPKKKSRMGF
ncbi:hypothetical protein DNTS_004648 [Danionella cerebrum]|uniref:TATA box-binding protein-associated factor RNA polymerase I subunit C n=1 Tax=Danionella cerebrum TaxID=2873325 RepID=A0A553QYE9_9TELE|nr:hypothetical protein DNTS_004648 [Danionella translucida]TRY94967.1 hypothetical protein DNTS_004648 [Danionella translucida]